MGCCPECKEWDSFVQINRTPQLTGAVKGSTTLSSACIMQTLDQVDFEQRPRMFSGIAEWDRVVGGGIIPGSLLVLTGDPGIGKSTLLLQLCHELARTQRVFYFSTEESLAQVKLRAQRLQCTHNPIFFSDQADLHTIVDTCVAQKPDIVIIDSIQNCSSSEYSFPGSIGQLRESTFTLMRLSKEHTIAVILSGHITKEGMIAGPKTLEHMVDGVFYLQAEERWQTRVLRSVKNRFGVVNELGFFQMEEQGLSQVPDINQHLIDDLSHAPGSVLVSIMEGSRPILLELQALTIESKLAMPQRVITGIDQKHVLLIAAILEKYLHIKVSAHDIFFKIAGGFKVKTGITDLGIALVLLSSYFQQPLPLRAIALGEISLTGQIKPINQIRIFIAEAEKFGINHIFIAQSQTLSSSTPGIKRLNNVFDLLSLFSVENFC
jgi:DNA repair protein RadA/Sms